MMHTLSPETRATHHRWLLELTQIPTVAGREQRVIAWIRKWLAERPELALTVDGAGNLHVSMRDVQPSASPIYFTAHLDHPAFVVERLVAPGVVQVSFRGGVMDEYFTQARVAICTRDDARRAGVITGTASPVDPASKDKSYLVELSRGAADVAVGDVGVWDLPAAEIVDGLIHTQACDDLAAAAGALAAIDVLLERHRREPLTQDVRLLFTRAEEIGFVGAIAACRDRTMPPASRLIALENSRSFEDSPIGGGPIVRVGDRLSIFAPSLTGAIARRAEELSGLPATPVATQKRLERPAWRWQRKLMAGGACEATVFCAYGYEATCVCLPLGNYHNMADLTAVQAGKNTTPPTIGREFVSISDFDGLVDLLVACGERLPDAAPVMDRITKLWNDRQSILAESL